MRPVSMLIPRNYLRVRGEYVFSANSRTDQPELPPRARRIPTTLLRGYRVRGTTSACAENTCCISPMWTNTWNYLRVRGEYSARSKENTVLVELPPRARRIHI